MQAAVRSRAHVDIHVAGVSTDCVQAPTCWCGTCFFRVGYDMSSYIYEPGPKRLFLDKMLITHFPNMTSCQNFKGRPKTEYQAAPMTDIDHLQVIYIDASSHRVNLAKNRTAKVGNGTNSHPTTLAI